MFQNRLSLIVTNVKVSLIGKTYSNFEPLFDNIECLTPKIEECVQEKQTSLKEKIMPFFWSRLISSKAREQKVTRSIIDNYLIHLPL